MDGNIHTPLFDTTVNLMYKAVLKEDPTNFEKGDYNVQITIPGKYTVENGDNEKPDTLPALREWKGGKGEFTLTDTSAIVIAPSADARTEEIANDVKDFFKDCLLYTSEPLGLRLTADSLDCLARRKALADTRADTGDNRQSRADRGSRNNNSFCQ